MNDAKGSWPKIYLNFLVVVIFLVVSPKLSFCTNVYEQFRTVKSSFQRQELALKLHVPSLRNSPKAFSDLKNLYSIAKDLDDKALECLYYSFTADQHSVVADGINSKSDSYHRKAIEMAKRYHLPAITIVSLINYGNYYYTYRQLTTAYKYYLEADLLLKELDLSKLPLAARQFKNMGHFFYYIKDYNQSIHYLKLGLKYPSNNKREAIDIANTIALCYRMLNNDNQAKSYFDKAMVLATTAKDSVWVGIVAGNVGQLYRKNNQLDLALKQFQINLAYSERFDEKLDVLSANINIAEIYTQKKQWNLVEKYLDDAKYYLAPKPFFLKYHMDVARLRAAIAEGRNEYTQQVKYLKQYSLLKDSLDVRDNASRIEREKLLWEKQQFEIRNDQITLEITQEKLKRKYLILLSVLLAVIIFLVYRWLKQKNKIAKVGFEKQQLLLLVDQEKIAQELVLAKEELSSFMANLKEKNKLITQMRNDFALLDAERDNGNEQLSLKMLLESHLMTDQNWLRFRDVFTTVYPQFFDEVVHQNPTARESDLRMLALIKLDLNNREISNLLGITIDGVKKAKQRLKKKMEASSTNDVLVA